MNVEAAVKRLEYQELPVLDLGKYLDGDDGSLEGLAEMFRYACSEIGFFALSNHGVSDDIIRRTFDATEAFHTLPMEQKLAIRINQNQRGYIPPKSTLIRHSTYNENTKLDLNETYVFATDLDPTDFDVPQDRRFYGANQWPAEPAEFKATVQEYTDTLVALGKKMLPIVARSLGLEKDFFKPYFENNYTYARMAHYPPDPSVGENEFGLGAHADTGFMTLLPPANVEGLDIQDKNGDWKRLPVIPNVMTVNIGMFLSRWTNDFFRATPHRVVSHPTEHRYSIPVFVNTSLEARAECLETCTSADNPPHYESESYWDFFNWYMTNTYPHYKEFHNDA